MNGIAAFIKEQEDGTTRLVFNDVEANSDTENPDWKHIVRFTSNCYKTESLKGLALSKEQFAEIGENIIIRLLALNGQIK